MTIKEAQEAVDRWIKEYGVRYFSELTNMAVLTVAIRVSKKEKKTTSERKWPTCFGCLSVWQTRLALTSLKSSRKALRRRPSATH